MYSSDPEGRIERIVMLVGIAIVAILGAAGATALGLAGHGGT